MSNIESRPIVRTAFLARSSVSSQVKPSKSAAPRMKEATSESQKKYVDIANDDAKFENFAFGLIGKTADERTPEENAALAELREEMRNGEISPEVVEAGPANGDSENRLPAGARGAYVSGGDGEQGRILLSGSLRGQQLQRTSDEEQGEAIADRAEELGIDVADGDAGARLSHVANGTPVSLASGLFKNQASDTVTFVSNGELVMAEADAGPTITVRDIEEQAPPTAEPVLGADGRTYDLSTEQGKLDYLGSLDANGDGYLDGKEFAQVEGVSEKEAGRLVAVYGVGNEEGGYGVPLDEHGLSGADNMLEDAALRLISDIDGNPVAMVDFNNISGDVAAHAMVRAEGFRRYREAKENGTTGGKTVKDFTDDVYEEGMPPEQMDWASDFVFNDKAPFGSKNKHHFAIAQDFTGSESGPIKADDLENMFATGAIEINGTQTREDLIGFNVKRGKRPPINTPEDFNAYLQKFDTDGTPGLSKTEFSSAINHYCGDRVPSDADISQLYMMFSTYDPENGPRLTDSGAEAMMTEGVFSPTRANGHFVHEWNVTPARAQTAIFTHVAEQRGVSADGVVYITPDEFNAAMMGVFGADIGTSNLSNYGTMNANGATYFSGSGVAAMFKNGKLGFDAAGKMVVDSRSIRPSDGSEPAAVDPSAPYEITNEDHPDTANYGTGWFKGAMHVSDEQIHLTEGRTPDGLNRLTIYVPEQAMEPAHGQPAVMNPPEFRTKGPAGNTIGRINPQDKHHNMHRQDNGDGTVTWTINGQEKDVQKGSKLDTYLSDYLSFSTPGAKHLDGPRVGEGNHLKGRPNLEMVDSYQDQNGNVVKVWSPRDHQFRTDAAGNKVPVETAPVVTIDGKVVQPDRMYIGQSQIDGTPIVGFEVMDPQTGETSVHFIPAQNADGPKAQRAITSMAIAFDASGNLEASDVLLYEPGTQGHNDLLAFEEHRINQNPPAADAQSEALVEHILTQFLNDPDVQADIEAQEQELVQDGVMLDGEAMEALGFIPPNESDPDQVYFVERTPELQTAMTAFGMGDMDAEIVHTVPPSHRGRTLNGPEVTSWGGGARITPATSGTDIADNRATTELGANVLGVQLPPNTKVRCNARVKYASVPTDVVNLPGGGKVGAEITYTSDKGWRVDGIASGEVTSVVTVRCGTISENGRWEHSLYVEGEAGFSADGQIQIGDEILTDEGFVDTTPIVQRDNMTRPLWQGGGLRYTGMRQFGRFDVMPPWMNFLIDRTGLDLPQAEAGFEVRLFAYHEGGGSGSAKIEVAPVVNVIRNPDGIPFRHHGAGPTAADAAVSFLGWAAAWTGSMAGRRAAAGLVGQSPQGFLRNAAVSAAEAGGMALFNAAFNHAYGDDRLSEYETASSGTLYGTASSGDLTDSDLDEDYFYTPIYQEVDDELVHVGDQVVEVDSDGSQDVLFFSNPDGAAYAQEHGDGGPLVDMHGQELQWGDADNPMQINDAAADNEAVGGAHGDQVLTIDDIVAADGQPIAIVRPQQPGEPPRAINPASPHHQGLAIEPGEDNTIWFTAGSGDEADGERGQGGAQALPAGGNDPQATWTRDRRKVWSFEVGRVWATVSYGQSEGKPKTNAPAGELPGR